MDDLARFSLALLYQVVCELFTLIALVFSLLSCRATLLFSTTAHHRSGLLAGTRIRRHIPLLVVRDVSRVSDNGSHDRYNQACRCEREQYRIEHRLILLVLHFCLVCRPAGIKADLAKVHRNRRMQIEL